MNRAAAILTVAGALAKAFATDTHTPYATVMRRLVHDTGLHKPGQPPATREDNVHECALHT